MKDFNEKIIDYEKSNPLSLFYEFGLSPDDIKSSIIDAFSEYFQNVDNLHKYAISDLVSTWLSFIIVYKDHPDYLKYIKSILNIFNEAKKINKEQTFEAYATWFPDISQSISRYWSLYNNQTNIKELSIEDFLEESLRGIGQSIEGLSKPFLKLIFQLNRIRRNKSFDLQDIKSKDLGIVIDELISTSELTDFLIVAPNSIRLNQWRNIAYHHNSKVIKGEIICWYTKKGQIEEFKISRDDLYDTLKNILLRFKLIRISETIFCIDNIIQIQGTLDKIDANAINIREEAELLDFYSSLSSQGFKVIDLKKDDEVSILKLQDMQEYGDFQKRAIHSSQFLYNLWIFTKSSKLIIEYCLFVGDKFLQAEISSDTFVKYSGVKTEISELLKDVKFTFVTLQFAQNKDPFKNLELSAELKSHSQTFFSQQGEKISIEEFSKQFILTVFTSYLAIKSEGLTGIKINIGSDGSLVRTENLEKNIVLQIPARIENKAFQLKLIELLAETIELYDKGELRWEIVDEAKNNNQYYTKKSFIKEHLKTM